MDGSQVVVDLPGGYQMRYSSFFLEERSTRNSGRPSAGPRQTLRVGALVSRLSDVRGDAANTHRIAAPHGIDSPHPVTYGLRPLAVYLVVSAARKPRAYPLSACVCLPKSFLHFTLRRSLFFSSSSSPRWRMEVETARPLVRSLQIHRYRDKDCGTAGLDASSKQIIFYHVFA
jgi:hypothetical protein